MRHDAVAHLRALADRVGAAFVDCKLTDLLGRWHHITYPIARLDEDAFSEGLGLDGSALRGWASIHASDLLLVPDLSTLRVDPFLVVPTLSLVADVVEPGAGRPYSRDPRAVARRAERYLRATGIADTAYVGPEPEFFVFDGVRFESSPRGAMFELDSREGAWTSGRHEPGGNLGHKPRWKGGYFPVAPVDTLGDLRSTMAGHLQALGIVVETHHHETATAGQCEIDMKYASLGVMADQVQWFKHVVKNVARSAGKTATFMPKPLFGDAGSGMHTHLSLWQAGRPLFAGEGYAGLSPLALHAIGGILHHARALCAFTNPTENSYRRLAPGYEAPVNIAYSASNRSASLRIPTYSSSPAARRIEYRTPDPSCNPYLAFAALLMAALDGIERRRDPGPPLHKDLYALAPEERAGIASMPGSLDEALAALAADHSFLLRGEVFSSELIDVWIAMKRQYEVDPVRLRPHPHEFDLYYDV